MLGSKFLLQDDSRVTVFCILSSGTLSVGGHCAPHRGSPSGSVIGKNLSRGSARRGQYQGGITLALLGSARWSLAYQGVFCCSPIAWFARIGLTIKA